MPGAAVDRAIALGASAPLWIDGAGALVRDDQSALIGLRRGAARGAVSLRP